MIKSMLRASSLFYILQCNRTIAFNALFNQMLLGPTKVALIGSGCSVATEPTAEVSQFYNITQVGHDEKTVTNCQYHVLKPVSLVNE